MIIIIIMLIMIIIIIVILNVSFSPVMLEIIFMYQ